MTRSIRAVLFDLDGTLADTAPDMARAVNAMRAHRGLDPVPLAQVRPHVSSGARGLLQSAFGVGPEHGDFPAMREEFLHHYESAICVETALFPGVDSLLSAIEAKPLAWGIVTNKHERYTHPLVAALGLASRAGVVVGGDTCERAKPFPDPLLFAAKRLAVPPSAVLYVGDDVRDVHAARAAGMAVVAAGYGYLGEGLPPHQWGADAVVAHAGEIAPHAGL